MRHARRYRTVIVAALGVSILVGCQRRDATVEPAPDPTKEAEVLRAAEIAWSREMAEKNPQKMAAHYATGAPIYWSHSPLIHGPQGIKAAMAKAFQDPAFKAVFTPDEVSVAKSGDLAYVTGAYSFTSTNPRTKTPATVEGAYLTVYTKALDGRWLVAAEFAGDLPQAADDDDEGP